MLNIRTEVDKWSADASSLGAPTIEKLLQVGLHWMQIKHLEVMEKNVISGTPHDPDFLAKMQGVNDFLFDLSKKIGQKL